MNFKKISFLKWQKEKEIILIFDGKSKHGGLVDRLKGIVSMYQIAKKINTSFKIYFEHPFELKKYLEPNQYNWTAIENDLKWNPFQTKIVYLMDDFDSNPLQLIEKSNKKKLIVFANIDFSKTINPELNHEESNRIWKQSFDELFKKTDYLKSKLDDLQLIENSIAIHTRFTNVLGDFKDTVENEVSDNQKEAIVDNLKNQILEIEKQNEGENIYIFSDSIRFLNNIKATTNYKVIEGSPVHVDFYKNNIENIDPHLKTFIDFFSIANCKKVYLIKTKEMYNSAFSKYAAIVGGNEFIN